MILTNNDHDQMTTVLKSDYSVHVINNESPQLSQLRACFMKTYYKFKTVENFYYDLLECNIFPLSHTTRYAERGCNCRQETDGDLKNGLPSVCFHFTHFDSILKVKLNIFVCFT